MISPSQLLPDRRRERLLEEIRDHQEDHPSPESLGADQIIIDAFNHYVMQRRTRNRIIIFCIAATAFFFTLSAHLIAENTVDTIDVWWQTLIVVPAFIFVIPVTLVTIPILALVPNSTDYLESSFIVPLITACVWAALSYAFLNMPSKFHRHFAKN